MKRKPLLLGMLIFVCAAAVFTFYDVAEIASDSVRRVTSRRFAIIVSTPDRLMCQSRFLKSMSLYAHQHNRTLVVPALTKGRATASSVKRPDVYRAFSARNYPWDIHTVFASPVMAPREFADLAGNDNDNDNDDDDSNNNNNDDDDDDDSESLSSLKITTITLSKGDNCDVNAYETLLPSPCRHESIYQYSVDKCYSYCTKRGVDQLAMYMRFPFLDDTPALAFYIEVSMPPPYPIRMYPLLPNRHYRECAAHLSNHPAFVQGEGGHVVARVRAGRMLNELQRHQHLLQPHGGHDEMWTAERQVALESHVNAVFDKLHRHLARHATPPVSCVLLSDWDHFPCVISGKADELIAQPREALMNVSFGEECDSPDLRAHSQGALVMASIARHMRTLHQSCLAGSLAFYSSHCAPQLKALGPVYDSNIIVTMMDAEWLRTADRSFHTSRKSCWTMMVGDKSKMRSMSL